MALLSQHIVQLKVIKTMHDVKPGILHVGTSGIVLPGNKLSFPTAFRDKSRLSYYASLFNTLEINSTFYNLAQAKTFTRWAAEVPASFQFSVKLSKAITHAKDLQFNITDVDHFLQTVAITDDKRGALLVQFPSKIHFGYFAKVRELVQHIYEKNQSHPWKMALEFRHVSWYNEEVIDMLNLFKAAIVLHDIPASKNTSLTTEAHFLYQRFHGSAGDYRGSYDKSFLNSVIRQSNQWIEAGKDVYLYFNNTVGAAFANAFEIFKS